MAAETLSAVERCCYLQVHIVYSALEEGTFLSGQYIICAMPQGEWGGSCGSA